MFKMIKFTYIVGLYILCCLVLYLYNPYFLLRPLQIVVDEKKSLYNGYNLHTFEKDIPFELFDLLKISNTSGSNYSITRQSLINKYLLGIGNCSQQSKGFGLILDSLGIEYSIVHFLPNKNLFEGQGHTVLRIINHKTFFIIDPIFKMVLAKEFRDSNKICIDLEDLRNRRIGNWNFNNIKVIDVKGSEKYYDNNYALCYAEVSQNDMNYFYLQNERILKILPLNEGKINRIIINGIAAITNKLPKFKVTETEFKNLTNIYPYFLLLKYIAFSFILSIYIFIFLLLVRIILLTIDYSKKIF